MKSRHFPPGNVVRSLAIAMGALLATEASVVLAANTDIANIPLANASTSRVLPNVWFILDDSGSMAWETIPGATNHKQFIPNGNDAVHFWRSSHCNGLAYDPNYNYTKPPTFTNTTYNDQTYTSANSNGFAKTGSVNLTGKIYFKYTGTQQDVAFTYTGSTADTTTTFYKECNSTPVATITVAGSTSCSVTSVKVNGTELLSGPTTASATPSTIASRIATNISTSGYAAMVNPGTAPGDNTQVWIYSGNVADATKSPVVTPTSCGSGGSKTTFAVGAFPSTATAPGFGLFTPYKLTASSGATAQTNYANWYAYYRTRVSMAKSAIGLAFKDLRGTPKSYADDPTDGDYLHARVGYTSLHDNSGLGDVAIGAFDTSPTSPYGTKGQFYSRLYGAVANNGTPLRETLKAAGDMYLSPSGGIGSANDPIKFYCQRNNVIVTTDGYWNGSDPGMANQDGGSTPRPQYEGPTATSNTLADVAMYYYKTDLRSGGDAGVWDLQLKERMNANTQIDDVARWQHMVTFTVGMGVDGTLKYNAGYKTTTDTNSDFYKIWNDTGKNWPEPAADDPKAVDDLWHAAVNGRGTYFNSKNAAGLAAAIRQALAEMDVAEGGGSANATSSLNTSSGDHSYVTSYTTSDWTGNLKAMTIGPTGELGSEYWVKSAAEQVKSKIAADGKSDTRTIFTGRTSLVPFIAANVNAADFDNTKISQSAYDWSSTEQSKATVTNLVNYLRGQSQYEIGGSSPEQLYRSRKAVLGDIVHSQPIYVGPPSFNFDQSTDPLDTGYATFKTNNLSRAPTLYVGSNDGMVHAFDAENGAERWAYVPPILHANMWRLADVEFRWNHRYFVDGPGAAMDAKIGGEWRTMFVGALGAGGRGYYALDITDPAAPAKVWSFTAENDADVGYTFGAPVIVKVDGQWVAVLASGYNNVQEPDGKYPGGSGKGFVFVVRLSDGGLVRKIPTGEGSSASPSGLATINVEVKSGADYTARKAYGGDLLGNMYRFDLSSTATATKVMSLGTTQPITSAPEIARPNGVNSPPFVYFGTGRYLGKSDLQETAPAMQAFYGVKDDGNIKTPADLAHYTLAAGQLTTGGGTKADGWYADLATSGERVNIHPQIQLGVVLFVTTIPPQYRTLTIKNSYTHDEQVAECTQSDGEGYLYQLQYQSGLSVDGSSSVGQHLDSPPVGLMLIGTANMGSYSDPTSPDGRVVLRTSDGQTITTDIKKPPMTGSDGKATRVQWRELLQ